LCKQYLLSYKYKLTIFVIISLVTTSIGIILPFVSGSFLNNLLVGDDRGIILRFCIVFGVLSFAKILIGFITAILRTKIHNRLSFNLNRDSITQIQGQSLYYINQQDNSYLNQRLYQDSNNLMGFSIGVLQSITTNLALFIIPFVILMNINWHVTMLMGGFLMLYVALYFALRKPLYSASFGFKETQAKLISKLYEQLKFAKTIKINSIKHEINQRMDNSFSNFETTAICSQKIYYLYSSLDGFIVSLAQMALFVFGGILVLEGSFTIGMFVVFSSYFKMMIGAGRYFFGLGALYQNNLASYERLREIFENKQESCGKMQLSTVTKIELSNINFSFGLSESNHTQFLENRTIIKNFDVELMKGNIYALKGGNGTGKSTLVSLIIGMYIDDFEGGIYYDGIDINEIDMSLVRKKIIGFAEQEPLLFNDTIMYNLDFGYKTDDNISTSLSLDELIKLLNMEDFMTSNNLDFIINDKNNNISGGERQKIAILRVLYKNPTVMIFDEPTSAFDTETTKKFIEYLRQIKNDKIIVIITHDECIEKSCDCVIELS